MAPADNATGRLGFNTASLYGYGLDEALEIGFGLGFRCVEVLAFEGYRNAAGEIAGRFFDRLSEAEIEGLARRLERFDRVAVHAPFWDVLPFSPNACVREATRDQLRTTLTVAGAIGAETVTTHVIPRLGYAFEEFRPDVVALYRELGDVASAAGVTLTIETGYPREIHEFAALVHEIGHPEVGANVDVGHLRGLLTEAEREPEALGPAYNALLARHVESLGDRIYHVHLHDVRPEGVRDHREAGTGVINYEAFFRMLMDRDYRGLLCFELEDPEPVEALARSRDVVLQAMQAAGL